MRAVALISLFFGFLMPRMLDGQPYTNTIFGIVCGCIAILCGLASKPVKGSEKQGQWEGRIMAGLGLILAVFLTTQLPEARRVQTKFDNQKKRDSGEKATGGKPEPRNSATLVKLFQQ